MCLMKFLTGVVLVLFAFSNSCAQPSQSIQDTCPDVSANESKRHLYFKLQNVRSNITSLLKSEHIPTLSTDDNTAQSYREELSNFTDLFVMPCNPNREEWAELENIQGWMKASIAALQQIKRDIMQETEATELTTFDFEMRKLLHEMQCYLHRDQNTYNPHRDDSIFPIRNPLARHRTLEQMHYRNRYIVEKVQQHLHDVAEDIMLCDCGNRRCNRKRASWLERQLRKRDQEFLLDDYEPGLDRPAKRAWDTAGFEDMGMIEEEYGYEPEIKRAWETLLGPAVVESDKRDWDRYEETPAVRYTAEDVKRAWEFLHGQRDKPRKRLSQSWMTNL